MQIEINNIKVTEEQIEAVIALKGSIRECLGSRYEFGGYLKQEVAKALTEKLVLERGAGILNEITDKQLINAVIIKAAGRIGGE